VHPSSRCTRLSQGPWIRRGVTVRRCRRLATSLRIASSISRSMATHTVGCNSMEILGTPGCREYSRTYSRQYHPTARQRLSNVGTRVSTTVASSRSTVADRLLSGSFTTTTIRLSSRCRPISNLSPEVIGLVQDVS
jgi:hypothetical protein